MGVMGCTQRTRGSRRVGSALEWQGGRRVSAHVQPARTFQGVSCAPGSAQHGQSVQDVSFASGRVCEKEEREKERERGERVTRVTTLWRGVRNTSTRASM